MSYTIEQREIIERALSAVFDMAQYSSLCETLGESYDEKEEQRLDRIFRELLDLTEADGIPYDERDDVHYDMGTSYYGPRD
jgi:hypothetical protein